MYNPVAKQLSKFIDKFRWATILGTPLVAGVLLFNPPTSAQQVKSPPIFENATISPNSSPKTMRGIGGGSVAASKVAGSTETATGACVGFVDEKADHTLVLTSFFKNLTIQVESPEDSTIVIKGPGGTWCNDDYQGKNPGISGQWLEGTYKIWVGTYKQNNTNPYVIRLTPGK